MRSPRVLFARTALLAAAATLALLHACQDTPEPTAPELAATAALKTLTVKGSGSGSGVVTSSPAGITCTITAGVAAATGCSAAFTQGVAVTLTPVPRSGHAFRLWSGACTGTGTCRVTMTVSRTVTARFLKGPFTVKIGGGGTGAGSGTVTSQAGLTPAIACVITDGTPAATGCAAKYPAYTAVTLTATPVAGAGFSGWGAPCSGIDACQYVAIGTVTIAATFAPAGPSTAATQGKWNAAFPTPVVAIHMNLLPTGKVLLWGHTGESQLWDPASPAAGFTQVNTPFEIFCSGHSFLSDGRLLVAGGHISSGRGLPMGAIFDPFSASWSRTPVPMAQGRWYPTTTLLPNGDMLVLAGSDKNGVDVPVPEIWDGSTWRRLITASLVLPYYPRMFVAPNAKVFFAGATSYYLDVTAGGRWTPVANRNVLNRGAGSAAMYAPGKILYAGGNASSTTAPTASAEVIDLNVASPAWRSIAPMAYSRHHTLATILADGQVLMTHGTGGPGNDLGDVVHYPELWNPGTESWSTMARELVARVYHSTALLLPDARVLSSGSGEAANVSYANSQFSAQVFTPPYLFNPDGSLATRPTITTAPSSLSYGQSFAVETPDAGTVGRGTLIRLSSVTHSFNQSQHIYPLTFTPDDPAGTTLHATAPADANLAPPGPYMLFLLNGAGVPSVAKMVTVGP